MPQSNRTTRCMGGFTLVELLVVESIIALLLGILLPALGKARTEAMRVRCMTDVRNLNTATIFYATDNDNQVMVRRVTGTIDFPHATGVTNSVPENYVLNDFAAAYLDTRDRLFCPSRLMESHSPTSSSSYERNYMTRQYFGDFEKITLIGGTWLIDPRPVSITGSGNAPIWACLTIHLNNGTWLAHDRPHTSENPQGQTSGRLDGSAQWVGFNDLEHYWTKNSSGQHWYWER